MAMIYVDTRFVKGIPTFQNIIEWDCKKLEAKLSCGHIHRFRWSDCVTNCVMNAEMDYYGFLRSIQAGDKIQCCGDKCLTYPDQYRDRFLLLGTNKLEQIMILMSVTPDQCWNEILMTVCEEVQIKTLMDIKEGLKDVEYVKLVVKYLKEEGLIFTHKDGKILITNDGYKYLNYLTKKKD